MTETDEAAEMDDASVPDPAWFESETGEFWFELVIRDRTGTREARLTEVEGRVTGAPSAHLTEADLDLALVNALRHLAGVIEGGG